MNRIYTYNAYTLKDNSQGCSLTQSYNTYACLYYIIYKQGITYSLKIFFPGVDNAHWE